MLLGCDFSSSPDRRKPIVLALGRRDGSTVTLDALERLPSLDDYRHWLARPRAWVGGFDFPFGLPRELVLAWGWPTGWRACIETYAACSRAELRERFKAFCAPRPAGGKFAHRATDGPAGASPSMKWVNPPVAYMLHAGVPPLIAAGVHVPGLLEPAPSEPPPRVALEAYPGLLARELLGRSSYKSDDRARQTEARREARVRLVEALEQGRSRLGLRLVTAPPLRAQLIDDPSGDSVDAVLCLVQAAWGERQGAPWYGLPEGMDPLEGWIVSAPAA